MENIQDNFIRKILAVPHVVDGDTMDVVIDLGYDPITTKKRLRFLYIDTPERGEKGFDEAKAFVMQHVKAAETVWIQTTDFQRGSFRRWLAEIFIDDGDSIYSLNDLLLKEGLAVPYVDN